MKVPKYCKQCGNKLESFSPAYITKNFNIDLTNYEDYLPTTGEKNVILEVKTCEEACTYYFRYGKGWKEHEPIVNYYGGDFF